jgi:bifunctional non-homologous end joining protein LigD
LVERFWLLKVLLMAAIPEPMLGQPGPLSAGDGWAFELKLDGFRALVDTHDGLRVVSRRGWNMTDRLPEPSALPEGLTLDGELVAWGEDEMPSSPQLGQRVLHGRQGIAVTLFVFDVLCVEGHDTMCLPYLERRAILEALELPSITRVLDSYNDGPSLFEAVCRSSFEGVVAKRLADPYRPGRREWVKSKNRDYWRYPLEVTAMASERSSSLRNGSGGS